MWMFLRMHVFSCFPKYRFLVYRVAKLRFGRREFKIWTQIGYPLPLFAAVLQFMLSYYPPFASERLPYCPFFRSRAQVEDSIWRPLCARSGGSTSSTGYTGLAGSIFYTSLASSTGVVWGVACYGITCPCTCSVWPW